MKEKRRSKGYLTVLVSATVFLAGSMTAFAYERPQIAKSLEDTSEIEGEYFFIEGVPEIEPVLYDSFWVNADGSVEEIMDDELEERAVCSHTFKEGTYGKHNKDSSGGCTVTYWKAKKCIKCGYMDYESILNKVSYQKCPH